MLIHEHLIVKARIKNPPMDSLQIEQWVRALVSNIDMKLLAGPYALYLDKTGNRGITCVAIIETSHIAVHVWDEDDPAEMQLDVYSCSALDKNIVFEHLKTFEPVSIEYKFLDRTTALKEVQTGII